MLLKVKEGTETCVQTSFYQTNKVINAKIKKIQKCYLH